MGFDKLYSTVFYKWEWIFKEKKIIFHLQKSFFKGMFCFLPSHEERQSKPGYTRNPASSACDPSKIAFIVDGTHKDI